MAKRTRLAGKYETNEQKAKRLKRNEKARANHWKKTGVSDKTIQWMKEMSFL